MNILITGGSGFVGSHMTRRLLSVMPEARLTLWLRPTSDLWRLADIQDNITIAHVDLKDTEAVAVAMRALRPEAIYHFANAGVYGGISASPRELLEVNTEGLINLLESLEGLPNPLFINVGSSSEYGCKESAMKEDDLCEPQNFYGVSKLAATLVASMHGRLTGLPIATYRIFSPFGPYDDGSRLVSRTILACMRKTPLLLPNSASVRDYIFIDDVIDLFVEALSHKPQGDIFGEVFNVGSGVEVKAIDVAYLIGEVMGARDYIDTLSRAAGISPSESPRWQADMQKTFTAFLWRPRHALREGIEKTIGWYEEHSPLYR